MEGRGGDLEKPHDLRDEIPVARTRGIPRLGKNFSQRHAIVLDAVRDVLRAETHFRLLDGDIEFVEQLDEIWVGHLVEDDEAGVDRELPRTLFDIDRVAVSADVVVSFDEGDVGVVPQLVGTAESGNAGSDDGDLRLHGGALRSPRLQACGPGTSRGPMPGLREPPR